MRIKSHTTFTFLLISLCFITLAPWGYHITNAQSSTQEARLEELQNLRKRVDQNIKTFFSLINSESPARIKSETSDTVPVKNGVVLNESYLQLLNASVLIKDTKATLEYMLQYIAQTKPRGYAGGTQGNSLSFKQYLHGLSLQSDPDGTGYSINDTILRRYGPNGSRIIDTFIQPARNRAVSQYPCGQLGPGNEALLLSNKERVFSISSRQKHSSNNI